MGCDIHAHSEVKLCGQWHHMDTLNIPRDYNLFCRMAGVRGGYPSSPEPIAKPRGIPEDITFITQLSYERWGNDGHSHSWLSGAEVAELTKDFGWIFGSLFGDGWSIFTEYPEDKPEWVEDARLVFWFDN